MNQKLHIIFVRLGLLQPAKVMYVGGSDVLPPPLPGPQEQQLLLRLAQGDHTARQCLIEHNLRLVVYIALKTQASIWRISSPSGPSGSSKPSGRSERIKRSSWQPTPPAALKTRS